MAQRHYYLHAHTLRVCTHLHAQRPQHEQLGKRSNLRQWASTMRTGHMRTSRLAQDTCMRKSVIANF